LAAEVGVGLIPGPEDALIFGFAAGTRLIGCVGAEAKDAFRHGLKYADRVRMRALEDPVSHNFPYSFDDTILSSKPILKGNGYRLFQVPGVMNGKDGLFEIGVTADGVIDHRFFRPSKR
jgi:hypothetical protein